MSEHWSDEMPDDLSEPLRNIEHATTQMLRAVDEGRYLTAPEHIRADLKYLRGEARRAARYAKQATTTSTGIEGATEGMKA